jgi:hypothetical protein
LGGYTTVSADSQLESEREGPHGLPKPLGKFPLVNGRLRQGYSLGIA